MENLTTSSHDQSAQAHPTVPGARLGFSHLTLDPAFPLLVVLDGHRDDTPITQLHVHDAVEIGYCIEGSGTFYVGNKILPFRQGDFTVITDREFHRCRSSVGSLSRWVWFFLDPARLLVPHVTSNLAWQTDRFSGSHFQNVLSPESYPSLANYVSLLVNEARHGDEYRASNLRSLFLLLIQELHRQFPPPPTDRPPGDPNASNLARIAPALDLLAGHFHRPLTVGELADACHMSLRSFQVHFSLLMGTTPQLYLRDSRVHAAAAMLIDPGKSITDIALKCGFNSLSSFNRAFRKVYDTNPRDFRKQNI